MSASQHSYSLAGKRVFIAGASRGIGAEIAKAYAAQGAQVLIGYASKKDAADAVVQQIKQHSPDAPPADVVGGDISSASSAHAVASQVLSKVGEHGLDILVVAAGYMKPITIHEISQDAWDQHVAINVTGPLFLVQALLPHIRPEGRIVLFSTSLVAQPTSITPAYLPYLLQKGAIEQLVRVLARDPTITGAERRITVNAIAPGPVMTELFTAGKTQELINKIASSVPRQRIGEVDDIVGPALFLASQGSQWVNGQTLRVNGGMTN